MHNLKGKKVGRLTVLKFDSIKETDGNKFVLWLCKCSCGKVVKVRASGLGDRRGGTRSCGCLKEEYRKFGNHDFSTAHGMSYTHFYSKFGGMHDRCNGKNREYYHKKGIRVCNRWKQFEYFMDDMYQSYLVHVGKYGEKDTTLERRDNNGNYCPENCRWATILEQNLNKGDNKFIEWKGVKKTYSEWSKKIGGNRALVNARLRLGWSIERIMTTPVRKIII